jgi:serine/threonine-protein kinase
MGTVLRAHHLAMDRPVAVKVLHRELSLSRLAPAPEQARRFVREARATYKVASPHAVKVQDFAESPDGLLYMVMEFLDGRSVDRELSVDGPMAPRRALHVARQVAMALAEAHRHGLIHRDIKPANVMLVKRDGDPDFAVVLDFGLAKVVASQPDGLSAAALTQQGMVFGTPEYMAPELATGQPVDARTDLYALGATLYEMLVGSPPFTGATPMDVLVQQVKSPPPRLSQPLGKGTPPELEALIAGCLAKQPDERPRDAEALITAIDRVAAALPATPPGPHLAAVTLPPGALPSRGTTSSTWSPSVALPGLPSVDSALAALAVPRRSLLRAGLASAAAISVAVVAMLAQRSASRRAPVTTPSAWTPPVVAAIPADPPALDARGAPAPTPDAAAAPERATATIDGAVEERAAQRKAVVRNAQEHLRLAEAAQQAGNRLRQMAEADLALQADPRNLRARFLLGDALLASGDADNGCRQLRQAQALPVAKARLEADCNAD